MILDAQAQTVMLLTVPFGETESSRPEPLSAREWTSLSEWLDGQNVEPAALLSRPAREVLAEWSSGAVALERIERLLERGGTLGFATEKWDRANLWAVTKVQDEYPRRLISRLKEDAPPVLFGCGDRGLLETGGLGVVGSPAALDGDFALAERIGEAAAQRRCVVVAGGSRGVEQRAMLGALRNGGGVVGVLGNDLLRATTSIEYREHLVSGRLVLTTPFNPEAKLYGVKVASRSRYIYCVADSAVIVGSTSKRGETWRGAKENLEGNWVPLWVTQAAGSKSVNEDLVKRGARWWRDDLTLAEDLWGSSPSKSPEREESGLAQLVRGAGQGAAPKSGESGVEKPLEPDGPFYALFLERMDDLTARDSRKAEEIADAVGVLKRQAEIWLKRGVEQGRIRRKTRPVRYESVKGRPRPLLGGSG